MDLLKKQTKRKKGNRKVETNHGNMENSKMNIAKAYFKKQWKNEEFRHSYLEEKVKDELERRGKDETTRTDGKGQGDDTKGQTSGTKGGKGLPPDKGFPPGTGPGGQEPGSGELPGGGTGTDTTLGGTGQDQGGAGEQPPPKERPGGEGRTDTGGDRGDGVRGGERGTDTTLGKTPEGKGAPGESGGVKGTSALDQAIDALGNIEVPIFAPYEKAAEEDFYQEKMKPAAETITTAI